MRRGIPAKQSFACIAVATLPLGHASAAARGTEAAPLAREGNQAIELAGIAVQSQKTMRQHTAAEVGPKFLLDEPGCGLARFPRASEKRLELFADDAVEEGLFGGSGRVAGRCAVRSQPNSGVCSIRPCAFGFARVPLRAFAHRSRRGVRGSCRCVGGPQGFRWLAGFPRSRQARQRAYSGGSPDAVVFFAPPMGLTGYLTSSCIGRGSFAASIAYPRFAQSGR